MSGPRERIEGIDEALPEGETVLWQGAPVARAVARHVLHQRALAGYLLLLVAVTVGQAWVSRGGADALRLAPLPLGLSVLVLAVVEVLARLVAGTSTYAITTERLVLRVGIAFPMAINLPISAIEDAGIRTFPDGSGEVRIGLAKGIRLAYLALWPHARPRQLSRPEPLLIGLGEPQRVGAILRQVAQQHGVPTSGPRLEVGTSTATETVALA